MVRKPNLRRIFGGQERFVDFGVHDHVVGFFEAVGRRRNDLHSLHDQRRVIFEQNGIETSRHVRDAWRIVGQHNAAQAERFSVVRIDLQRRFEFAEGVAPAAQTTVSLYVAGHRVELILIVVRFFLKRFPIVFLEIEIDRVAESCADGAVGLVRDAEHVDRRVILAFFFVELQRVGRNFHRQIHARDVGSGIEIRRLDIAVNRASLSRRGGSRFELFFHRLAFERILPVARCNIRYASERSVRRDSFSLSACGNCLRANPWERSRECRTHCLLSPMRSRPPTRSLVLKIVNPPVPSASNASTC